MLVAQSCPTLWDPMDYSPPGSSVHAIFQARILEGIVISSSRRSSQSRDQTQVSCIAGRFFTMWATRERLCRSSAYKEDQVKDEEYIGELYKHWEKLTMKIVESFYRDLKNKRVHELHNWPCYKQSLINIMSFISFPTLPIVHKQKPHLKLCMCYY